MSYPQVVKESTKKAVKDALRELRALEAKLSNHMHSDIEVSEVDYTVEALVLVLEQVDKDLNY